MSWLPSPTKTIGLLQEIEHGNNLIKNTTELFWDFCLHILSPGQFQERIRFWADKQLEDAPKGGGFIVAETRDALLQGPEKFTQVIIDKLDKLTYQYRVPYQPDEVEDPIALYIYIHLEGCRLCRFLKMEEYSERTRETLDLVLEVINRCFSSTILLSEEDTRNLNALGAYLYRIQFDIRKSDGEYENALKSLARVFSQNMLLSLSLSKRKLSEKILFLETYFWTTQIIWDTFPWMEDLTPQASVDCFEAVKKSSNIKDPTNIAAICGIFIIVYDEWLTRDEEKTIIHDSEGTEWKVINYWHRATVWVETKLEPSELRELFNERQEQASENRLRTYFFNDDIWNFIPERAKRSLITADRDYFSSSIVRSESILNELRIAIEEILLYRFWKPFAHYVSKQAKNVEYKTLFERFREQTINGHSTLTLLDYIKACSLPTVKEYLQAYSIPTRDIEWFQRDFPDSLNRLRKERNKAEHESGDQLARQGLSQFWNEYIGIGLLGVLIKVCNILMKLKREEVTHEKNRD